MRMLIVEDEHHVRERIAEGIDWASGQIEVVDAVSNGREAVAIVEREHLDLIITDINMPDMSGLELAKQMHAEHPLIKLIILTGYDDFEFARESIEYNVYNYLVKPVTNERLWDIVQEVRMLHEQELREKHKLSMLELRWKEHLPHLQDIFYKNWLNGSYSLWEIEKRSADLNLSLEDKLIWPIVVDMDPIAESDERFHSTDRQLVQFSLLTLARDVFADTDCVTLQDDDGMTAIIFFVPQDETEAAWKQRIQHQLHSLLDIAKDCLKLTASAGIGPVVADKLLLPRAYKQCRMALQERIILGNDLRIHYRADIPVHDTWVAMNDLEKELEMAIETGNASHMQDIIMRIMELRFAAGISIAEAKEALLRMVCLLARIVHTHGWTMRDTLGEEYDAFEQYVNLITRNQIAEWLQRMSSLVSETIAKRRQTGTQIRVSEIIQFVQAHLHEEELSLYLLADKLYVNYSYLSRTFKKLMGESFSEYVFRLRMEKAKELLARGLLVYDVAEQVGFRHVNYFSKAFAKFWNGVKPSEVKKQS